MSVGLQRLRDDAAAVRKGAVDKGEDPGLVDAALAADARRRELLAEGDRLKADRNAASKAVGEAIRGGASADGPEVAGLRARSADAGNRITAVDAELATVEATLDDLLLRIPNPADLDVPVGGEEANVTISNLGRSARQGRAADRRSRGRRPGRGSHLGAPAALGGGGPPGNLRP